MLNSWSLLGPPAVMLKICLITARWDAFRDWDRLREEQIPISHFTLNPERPLFRLTSPCFCHWMQKMHLANLRMDRGVHWAAESDTTEWGNTHVRCVMTKLKFPYLPTISGNSIQGPPDPTNYHHVYLLWSHHLCTLCLCLLWISIKSLGLHLFPTFSLHRLRKSPI